MSLFTRPGVSISPVRPTRRAEGLARGDVPVLIGFATRGPAMEPVRVESLRQFQAIFGPAMPATHLFDAVKGFFETGGRTAYVMRLVGPSARVASVSCGANWQITARSPLQALGPLERFDEDMPWFDHLRRTYGLSLPDPGAWANDLSLVLSEVARQRGEAACDNDHTDTLFPRGMAGLSPHGLLRLSLGSTKTIVQISKVDTTRNAVILTENLPAALTLAGSGAITFQTVTFDAEILSQGQRLERFNDLHLAPEHPNSFAQRLNRQSASLTLDFASVAKPDWRDTAVWPNLGQADLSGGNADLSNLSPQIWQVALNSQARVDEISLVAMPDLVRQQKKTLTDQPAPPLTLTNCALPNARPNGTLVGIVRDAATNNPIEGCQVMAAGEGQSATTDANGHFSLINLSLGIIDLRFKKTGFKNFETYLQASTAINPEPPMILLQALDDIHAFNAIEITDIQRGALDLMGDYRVLVLDPPAPNLAPEALINWRTNLGYSARLFAVAPWLAVAQDASGNLIDQPPSGHICGAFARGELSEGVHRAPANIALRHAKALANDLDEPTLDAFHRVGLNPLRASPGQGLRLMGSRTLSATADWQQVSVRRLFDAIEKTLTARMAWSVFEANSTTTRAILGFSISQFLESLRRRGMFAGSSAPESYSVVCDASNNTPDSAARGELIVDIAVAPSKPYEFIRISLSAQADAIEVTETQ